MIQASELPLSEVRDSSLFTEAFEEDEVLFGKATKGVRNRSLTAEGSLGILEAWEDQNDQRRGVGFIMC